MKIEVDMPYWMKPESMHREVLQKRQVSTMSVDPEDVRQAVLYFFSHEPHPDFIT